MLKINIVIPCFNEPDVVASVQSIANCDPPNSQVNLIVVINSGINDSDEIKQQNIKSKQALDIWAKRSPNWLQLVVLCVDNIAPKIAGVGNARKVGMDYCLNHSQHKKDSIIVCFDADSSVSKNYLTAIEHHFSQNDTDVATLYFEHDYQSGSDSIVPYELFLRYHLQGLRYAGYPYAYQTIGSSMAVRANTYEAFGGMNQRKAGEDFYFLHKIIPYRRVGEINQCAVYPSARSSDRVPFGTGHAVDKRNTSLCKTYYTYSPFVYLEIKKLIDWIEQLELQLLPTIPVNSLDVLAFLNQENFDKVLPNFFKQSKTNEQLKTTVYRWLNGFRMLKLVHYLRDKTFTNIDINQAVSRLWKIKFRNKPMMNNAQWLEEYKKLEKGN